MTTKNILLTTLSLITVMSIVLISTVDAFAEETSYKMADNVGAIITFHFRDGVETHTFPVFEMTSNFVSNGEQTFNVQGVVNTAPYLHKALDESFKYRSVLTGGGSSIEYEYRFFDVTVDISNDGESIRTIDYSDCEVTDYKIETLSDDYESYGFYPDKVGFAIVDDIDFRCQSIDDWGKISPSSSQQTVNEYVPTPFKFAEDARTIVTFKFDDGLETIEFPIFELTSGFEEGNAAGPTFHVEGTVSKHPLLDNAIKKSQKANGQHLYFNSDFEALVEFTNNGEVVRGIDFHDCRVNSFLIDTYQDKEEGYTGKRGFALIESVDFSCGGLNPLNTTYDVLKESKSSKKMSNEFLTNSYNMGTGPHAIVTFSFSDGQEIIDFPIFEQENLLDLDNPQFELVGVPGIYPLLYQHVDENLTGPNSTGVSSLTDMFDADVDLVYGDDSVRGFNYTHCRSIDYVVNTQHDKEESFFKGFSLTNEFHFECQGYHPNNPVYDSMFKVEKAKTTSSSDLRSTDSWPIGFS